MRIAFATLGCKINQYETDLLRQDLASHGNEAVPFDGEADVYIINSCSVTAKSDTQCRQLIRSAARRGQGARVVVTGCYAETRPDELRNIPGVDLVIGNFEKATIPHQVMALATEPSLLRSPSKIKPPLPNSLSHWGRGAGVRGDVKGWGGGKETASTSSASFMTAVPVKAVQSRTRGFLKIQDGCNNRCSYCIVPLARGRSRSASFDGVRAEFGRLVQEGCPEVVLTGIHIGTYGADLAEGLSLTDMIAALLEQRGRTRIRLSSIEPREITDGIIGFLGTGLCRHLHIPLQSGDDGVLGSMKRDYTADFYLELLERIAQAVPGVALGADVMVGYPGEGDAEFQNTMRLVESAPLTHLHVFSYSPRPGTEAASMKGQVAEPIKKKRSEILRALGGEKNLAFREKHKGAELRVVVEDKIDAGTGLFSGLTDNYMRVNIVGGGKGHIGLEISVRITEVAKDANLAVIL